MALVKTKGFILRTTDVKDTDRYLTVLTVDYGLISVYATYVRSLKKGLMKATEPFIFGSFELFQNQKTDGYRLNQVTMEQSFSGMTNSIEQLTVATHLADVWIEVAKYSENTTLLYKLVAYTLHTLSELKLNNQEIDLNRLYFILRSAEIKTLRLAGFAFPISRCHSCKTTSFSHTFAFFNIKTGEFVCERCNMERLDTDLSTSSGINETAQIFKLSRGVLQFIHYCTMTPIPKQFLFEANPVILKTLNQLIPAYLEHQFEHSFNKMNWLNGVADYFSVRDQ